MLTPYLRTPDFHLESQAPTPRVREFLSCPERREYLFEWVGDGKPLTTLAEMMQVPFVTLHRTLLQHFPAEMAEARAAAAERLAEKNLEMADQVQALELSPQAAKAAAELRQWYMERQAADNYGGKSKVDVTVKGTVGLHLEAIRKLAAQPVPSQEIEDAEFEEIHDERKDAPNDPLPDDDEADHPLL